MESPTFKRAKFMHAASAIEERAASLETERAGKEMADGLRSIAAAFSDSAARLSHDLGMRCGIADCARCKAWEVE